MMMGPLGKQVLYLSCDTDSIAGHLGQTGTAGLRRVDSQLAWALARTAFHTQTS